MATTIKKLVYRVWAMLDGNIESSVESRFTYREIREAIFPAVAKSIVNKKFQDANNPEADSYGSDFDLKTYPDIPIKTDTNTGLYYLDLPAELVSTYDGRQISIFENTGLSYFRSTTYVPIKKKDVIITKFQSSQPCGVIQYFPEGKRVNFLSAVDQSSLSVTLKGSIPINDDEEITSPDDMLNSVVDEAYRILAPQIKPDDNAINGVPNP